MIQPIEFPIKWEDLKEEHPGYLLGGAIIFDQGFHVEAFQVVEAEGFNIAVNEEHQDIVEKLEDWALTSLRTVRNGDREYVLVITPHARENI